MAIWYILRPIGILYGHLVYFWSYGIFYGLLIGIFYGHLVYFTANWYIVWPFGIVSGHMVYFSCFGMLCQEKSGNPAKINGSVLAYQP
jgi:hypothetical protein